MMMKEDMKQKREEKRREEREREEREREMELQTKHRNYRKGTKNQARYFN